MDHLKQRIEDGCLVEQPAFCTAACPFHLNVPQFVDKLQRGNFSSAYRAYHKEVVFPGIVSRLCEAPCKALCPQARAGEAIDMPELERAAVAYTSRRSPNSYNLPEREQRIAIIGAGISGLTCALRLCSNKYRVTVYEKTDRIGGDLWNRLEPAFFLEEIEREFKNESYTLQLNTEILSLDTLEADAVYVATGAGGSSFGLAVNGGLTKSSRTGIFLGGALCGSNPVEAIADGLQAVTLIEQFLKTGAMADAPKMTGTLLPFGCREGGNTPAVRPKDGMLYSKEEAVEEAKRCLLCSCDACKRSCDLMEYYNKLPPRIAEEVYFTIHPAALWGNETFAKRLMETCNQCGACKDACPEQLDLGELIQDSRRIMRGLGKQAWVFHDYWLRDMENAMKDAHLVRKPDGIEQSEVVFFPGCQLGASDPRYVLKSYEWILRERPDAALWLSCCGVPALWAGAEAEREEALASLRRDWTDLGCPEVIFACPTCKKTFAKDLPDIKGRFLLEWMAERGFVPERALGGEEMAVFDPCASRNEPELQKAARTLAERSGASLIPLRDNGKKRPVLQLGRACLGRKPRLRQKADRYPDRPKRRAVHHLLRQLPRSVCRCRKALCPPAGYSVQPRRA